MPEFPDDLIDQPATFETMTGPKVTVPVHFNPASLQHTVSNTLKEEGKGAKKKQYVSQTTAKLTMDLTFDTTDTGEDVRITTNKMAQLLAGAEGQSKKVPPVVKFSWGAYSFTGMVEQYKETIDFFAAGGLPLRSSINLTLSSQDVTFEGGTSSDKASVDGELSPEPVVLPDDEGPSAGRRARPTRPAIRARRVASPRSTARPACVSVPAPGSRWALRRASAFRPEPRSEPGSRPASALRQGGFSASARASAGGSANLLPAAAFAAGGGAGAGVGIGGGAGSVSAQEPASEAERASAWASAAVFRPVHRWEPRSVSRAVPASRPVPDSPACGSRARSVRGRFRPATCCRVRRASRAPAKVAPGGRLIDAGGSGLKANVAGEADFVIGAR